MRRIVGFLKIHPFFFVVLVSFVLYLPIFLIPFSFHNDGSLVSCKGGTWLVNFDESRWIFMIGRPLYTIYLNIQTQLIHTVTDLSLSRLFYFLQMSLAMLLLWRFLKERCGVPVFWIALMGMAFFFTPFNVLSFLWVEMEAVGAPTVLIVGISYFLLDWALAQSFFKVKFFLGVAASAILFLMALCIYPSSALVVFAFSFARLIFNSHEKINALRRVMVRDILVYSLLMGLYLVLVKAVIIPFSIEHLKMTAPGGLYAFSLKADLISKLKLFIDAVAYSLRGGWDFIGSTPGTWIVLGALSVGLFLGRANLRIFLRRIQTDPAVRWSFLERTVWGLVLIFLGNAPSLLAGGCDHILGYRVLLPSTIMLTMVILKIFMTVDGSGENSFGPVKTLASVFILSMVAVSVWMGWKVVSNNHQEYVLAQKQLVAIDYSRVNRLMFLLNPRENKDCLGQPLPFEMGLMTASKNHAAAYLSGVLKQPRLNWPFVQAAEDKEPVYLTPKTAVIDLSINRDPAAEALSGRDVVILKPLSVLHENVVIDATYDKDSGALFTFKTGKDGKYVPFWLLTAEEPFAIFQIDSLSQAKTLSRYSFVVELRGDQGIQKNVPWELQGSSDGKSWVNLNSIKSNSGYNVMEPKAFQSYRFIWAKAQRSQKLYVYAIKLLLS